MGYELQNFKDGHVLTAEDLNHIEHGIQSKVDQVEGKGLSTNDFTNDYKTKLENITEGAQTNQNAFSNIQVNGTTFSANEQTDTLVFSAGNNIILTPNVNDKKITIAAKDTTYTAGSGLSISGTTINHSNSVTAKTVYNQDSVSLDYGEVFKITEPKYNEQGHITETRVAEIKMPLAQEIPTSLKNPNALIIGGKTYDGSKETTISASDLGLSNALHFIGVVTTLPATAENGDVVLLGNKEYVYNNGWVELGDGDSHALKTIQIKAGNGLAGGGTISNDVTLSHADTSNVGNVIAGERKYVTGLTFDTYGHVTGVTTGTETVVNIDTNTTYDLAASANSTNGNVKLNLTASGSGVGTDSIAIKGGGATTVTTDSNGDITINSTNTTYNSAGTDLGLVKTGGDVTISDGIINVNDDSHNHIIANIDGLQNEIASIETAIDEKVDKDGDKVLSTNDYTNAEKNKLAATNIAYGTCSTDADIMEKVVTLVNNTNWELTIGAIVMVRFTKSNSASNVKLNINNTGAYPIWYNNAEYTSTGTAYTGYAARTTTYMFNGSHWVWIANSYDSNTTYTNAKLGQGYAVCSTAATTAAKTASISSYSLTAGGIVTIKFTYDVPASATLNISGKGAKAIYHRGAAVKEGVIKAGDTATFIYSSQYHLISIDRDDNETYSNATTTTAGLMSAEDKTKLDNIVEKVDKTVIDNALSTTSLNPVQNKVITTALNNNKTETENYIDEKIQELDEGFTEVIHQMYGSDITENSAPTIRQIANNEASSALANANSYTDTKIEDLINGAPETLDTLSEIANAMAENNDVVSALNEAIGTKANNSDLTSHINNKSNPHNVTSSQIGAVPITRKINNKALSADITLTMEDLGIDPDSVGSAVISQANNYTDNKIAEWVGTENVSTQINNAISNKSDKGHNHDSLYDKKGAANEALESANAYTNEVKNDLLNGAGEAYDTLKELGELIDTNQNAIESLEQIATGKADAVDLTSHIENKANPHNVTASQVGADREGSANSALSSAKNYTEGKINEINTILLNNYYTKSTIDSELNKKVDAEEGKGLSTNDFTLQYINKISLNSLAIQEINSSKGKANGYAELDENGKVPFAQLPSYVDDVIEAASLSAFPATGETGKIYLALDTNKTYRWSGSTYTEISASLALGTTSSTAYPGDKGEAAYKHAVTNKGMAFQSGLYKITTNAEGHVTAATAAVKADITSLGIPAQDTTYNLASQNEAGLMSIADKTKLDNIAAEANKTIVDATLNSTSVNPVQNKVINTAISNLQTEINNKADFNSVNQEIESLDNSLNEIRDTFNERIIDIENSAVTSINNIKPTDGNISLEYLAPSGGNITGHLYFTGAKPNSSTASTSQIVFGTPTEQHVAISSNTKALVVNPNTTQTTNQIVLYLEKESIFPRGIKTNITGNCSGSAGSVNWNGITNKPSYYDAKAIKSITRNGSIYTYTCMDGTSGTFTQAEVSPPVKGEDYWTDEDKQEILDETENFVISELAQRNQLYPEFAQSIEECTDTNKLYVLPDGFIYAYMMNSNNTNNYTNQLPIAKELPTDSAPYNGIGYKPNTRLSISSGVFDERTETGWCASGLIKATYGDVIRLKNCVCTKSNPAGGSHRGGVFGADENGAFVAGNTSTISDITSNTSNPWQIVYDEDGDNIIQFTIPSHLKNSTYIRIVVQEFNANSIITVNEEIVEGESTYAWTNTGHAFVPADYEARINALDSQVRINTANIETLSNQIENSGGNTDNNVNLPDYWKTHADERILDIRNIMANAGRESAVFLWWHDAHWTYNFQKSPAVLKYLYNNTVINKTFYGGDVLDAEDSSEINLDTLSYVYDWRNAIRDLPNHYSVIGNHDDGNKTVSNGKIPEGFIYSFLMAAEKSPNAVYGDGFYYYIDEPAEKTRYIFMDTASENGIYIKDLAQQKFVRDALKSTPRNWHIVGIAHIWRDMDYTVTPAQDEGFSSSAQAILTMFDSYNSRLDDFAGCQGFVEFCIGAHTHKDGSYTSNSGIPVIVTETDSQHVRGDYTATANTISENSVNAIIADYKNKTIYVVRIGRGESYNIAITTYKNQITDSIDSNGMIYNEKGYKQVKISGETESNSTDRYSTGFIPVRLNDLVYFKNCNVYNLSDSTRLVACFNFYDCNFNHLGVSASYGMTNHPSNAWEPIHDDTTGDLIQVKIPNSYSSSIRYMRITMHNITDDSIVTVNEPIN